MVNDDSDRRSFLRTAAAAALTSSSLASAVPPSDRITSGFIGMGTMGSENMSAAMEQPGVRWARVCDVYQPHLERAAAAARRKGHKPKETGDFREVLADPSIDAVCISTPDHWHPYISVEACKAGKDVYVEKPACVSIDDGWPMIAAARKYKRVVQAGTWQRSGQHFQKACEMVRDGTLGKVTMCKTWIYSNQPKQGIGNPPSGSPPLGLNWEHLAGTGAGPALQSESLRRLSECLLVLPVLLGLRGRAVDRLGRPHARHRADGFRGTDAAGHRCPGRQVLVR